MIVSLSFFRKLSTGGIPNFYRTSGKNNTVDGLREYKLFIGRVCGTAA